jgi:quercetin dioxygenase-like cupin family protein
MPVVRTIEELPSRRAPGYTETVCAGTEVFGPEVPVRVRRIVVEPGATAPCDARGEEVMAYVAAGSGTLELGAERHSLERESTAWIVPGPFQFTAGGEGLEVLVVEAPSS